MIDIVIRAEDSYKNEVYVIHEDGNWRFINKNMCSMALSNYSDNATELYIALDSCDNHGLAIMVLKKNSNLKNIT